MIKKLRNKMLLMNMISIFCLVMVAFSAIYIITYNNVEEKIEESLNRTFGFHRSMWFRHQSLEGKEITKHRSSQRELRDISNFSVYIDSEQNVHTDSMLGENSKHYEEVAQAALKQNSPRGEFESEDVIWRFKTRELKDNAKVIALVDITAEKEMLSSLIISFTAIALFLLGFIFFISIMVSNRAMRPVTQAWERQKQFVADASHELKTPLTAINTNIDVLLNQPDKTIGSEEKWLRYIKTEVGRLSELTGNLLFMAKMDADIKVEKKMASISEIVESAVLNLEAVAFEKGVTLNYDIEKDISLEVNASQITRLCLILLDNAIKYSPQNSPVEILLSKNQREQAVLKITNMGEPIGDEDIQRIFDRFYRVDKARSTSGYGLGLAMAKEIVNIHKGKITVESSIEKGTQFTVTL